MYSYAVAAVDTTGNASALSRSVTATPDVTAPGAPTGLAATAGDAQVELSWTAPVDPDVAGYQVYRSETSPVLAEAGSLLGGGSATVFTDATAVNGTAYFYAVAALDAAGNTSALSGEASATPIAPDTTAPAVPGEPGGDLGHGSAGHPGLGSGHGAGSGRLPGVPGRSGPGRSAPAMSC